MFSYSTLAGQDKAKQALAKLALEPEWEAKFEPNSYGFRPGRSSHDAIEAIFLNICKLQHEKLFFFQTVFLTKYLTFTK